MQRLPNLTATRIERFITHTFYSDFEISRILPLFESGFCVESGSFWGEAARQTPVCFLSFFLPDDKQLLRLHKFVD